MSPRGNKRHPISPADARAYLSKANAWFEAATESLGAQRLDVAAGSAVTAGINACDAITGTLIGQRAGGDIGRRRPVRRRQLSQLLRFKTPAQYDPEPLPERDAIKAVELAGRLIHRATQVANRRR